MSEPTDTRLTCTWYTALIVIRTESQWCVDLIWLSACVLNVKRALHSTLLPLLWEFPHQLYHQTTTSHQHEYAPEWHICLTLTAWSHTIPGISLLSIFSLGEILGWVVGRCQSTIKVPAYSRIKRNHPFCAIFLSGEFRGNLTSIHFKNSFERRWKCFVSPMVPKTENHKRNTQYSRPSFWCC